MPDLYGSGHECSRGSPPDRPERVRTMMQRRALTIVVAVLALAGLLGTLLIYLVPVA